MRKIEKKLHGILKETKIPAQTRNKIKSGYMQI